MKWLVLVLFFVGCSISGSTQTILEEYDASNGLLSNSIYAVWQSQSGELWIASDLGISRYNGYEFEHYTAADGLPGDEVMAYCEDHAGRMWLGLYNGQVCYLKEDELVTVLPAAGVGAIQSRILRILEDEERNIWVIPFGDHPRKVLEGRLHAYPLFTSALRTVLTEQVGGQLYTLFTDDQNEAERDFYLMPLLHLERKVEFSGNYSNVGIQYQDSLFLVSGWEKQTGELFIEQIHVRSGKRMRRTLKEVQKRALTYMGIHGESLLLGTRDGLFVYAGPEKGIESLKFEGRYFSGTTITSFTEDHEGTCWIGTLGKGIKRMAWKGLLRQVHDRAVTRIFAHENGVVTTEMGGASLVSPYGIEHIDLSRLTEKNERVAAFTALPNGALLFGSGLGLFSVSPERNIAKMGHRGGVKDLLFDENLFVGRYASLEYMEHTGRDPKVEVLVRKRANRVVRLNDQFLFTNNQGGWSYSPNRSQQLTRFLTDKVYDAEVGRHEVWVSAGTQGVWRFSKEDTVQYRLKDPLLQLSASSDTVCWGISRSKLYKFHGDETVHFDLNHMFLPGRVSDVLVQGDTCYLGSSRGLFALSLDALQTLEIDKLPQLKLEFIRINGERIHPEQLKALTWKENNMELGFTGISFHPGSDMRYRYLVEQEGEHMKWKYTKSRQLALYNLNYGQGNVQVEASVDGIHWSSALHVDFWIAKPYYLKTWFLLVVSLSSAGLIAFLLMLRVRYIRHQESFKRRLLESEQKAIRAQMNPHFLFNVLNSIQQFFLKKEERLGHNYLTKFAHLIRTVLNNSDQSYLSLEEELNYLKQYVVLEQLRSTVPFEFKTELGPAVRPNRIQVPSMLIQPFIENAIWHAFPGEVEAAVIELCLRQEGSVLHVQIRDNGKGFDQEQKMRKSSAKEQPRGMDLVRDRVAVLNQLRKHPIEIHVKSSASGTHVFLTIPQP